jgi:hypothetical protein
MKYSLLAVILFIGLGSFAQKKEKEKKDKEKEVVKYLYKEATVETDDYNIYVVDVIADFKKVKFKIKIFNKTNDYLLIKPTEFVYLAGDKTVLSLDKTYVVSPNEEETEVIDFKGGDMLVEKFTVEFKGIYKASAGGKINKVSDFDLPPTKNEFTSDNFTCSLKKHDLKTDKSIAKFDCMYVGDGVGIINPTKASAIMPKGQENVNHKKIKPIILERGKKDDFTLVFTELVNAGDMQKGGIKVKWNESFRESKLLPIGNAKLELVKDSEKK